MKCQRTLYTKPSQQGKTIASQQSGHSRCCNLLSLPVTVASSTYLMTQPCLHVLSAFSHPSRQLTAHIISAAFCHWCMPRACHSLRFTISIVTISILLALIAQSSIGSTLSSNTILNSFRRFTSTSSLSLRSASTSSKHSRDVKMPITFSEDIPTLRAEWLKAIEELPSTPDNIPSFFLAHGRTSSFSII